jgi:response regulator RpfG family c-di-GMP phosphodiesterase
MREGRGTHFQPELLDLFFDNFAMVEEIQKQFRD